MKMNSRFAAVVLAAGLFIPSATLFAQGYGQGYGPGQGQGYGPGQGPGYGPGGPGGPGGGWDAPPNSYRRDLQRNAFRAGLQGAQRDLENRRRPDVNNRDEFRNYRGPDRRAYRQAFQAGYSAFWNHQGGPGRPGPRPY